jgi:precorrin-6B methylase 2
MGEILIDKLSDMTADQVKHKLRHPEGYVPWIATGAVDFLAETIDPDYMVLEVGAGRSTFWLAHRCRQVISFESRTVWSVGVMREALRLGLKNLIVHNVSVKESGWAAFYKQYSDCLMQRFNLFFLDGGALGARPDVAHKLFPQLVPGGYLLIDDFERKNILEPMTRWLGEPYKIFTGKPGSDASQTAVWKKTKEDV